MAGSVTQEIDQIFRHAVACRVCFRGAMHLNPALLDVAQPRWIGERYWDGLRIVIVLANPGAGKGINDNANRDFRRLIKQTRHDCRSLRAPKARNCKLGSFSEVLSQRIRTEPSGHCFGKCRLVRRARRQVPSGHAEGVFPAAHGPFAQGLEAKPCTARRQ